MLPMSMRCLSGVDGEGGVCFCGFVVLLHVCMTLLPRWPGLSRWDWNGWLEWLFA